MSCTITISIQHVDNRQTQSHLKYHTMFSCKMIIKIDVTVTSLVPKIVEKNFDIE